LNIVDLILDSREKENEWLLTSTLQLRRTQRTVFPIGHDLGAVQALPVEHSPDHGVQPNLEDVAPLEFWKT
jgi:hypothetical protein